MSTMHVSVFMRPKDQIRATSMAIKTTGSFSVTVQMTGDEYGEIALYADSAAQLLAFGQAIVKACETLADFDYTLADEPPIAPYAINDAVEHDAASAAAEKAPGDYF